MFVEYPNLSAQTYFKAFNILDFRAAAISSPIRSTCRERSDPPQAKSTSLVLKHLFHKLLILTYGKVYFFSAIFSKQRYM